MSKEESLGEAHLGCQIVRRLLKWEAKFLWESDLGYLYVNYFYW